MRYKNAIMIAALAACLTACEKNSAANELDGSDYWDADGNKITFVGMSDDEQVSETDIEENIETMESEGFFLPCTNGSRLIIVENYGPIVLSPDDGDDSVFSEFTVGDKVRAVHGLILESYPAQTAFYSIEKLSDGTLSDIPEDMLKSLEELGWIYSDK